ncbi:transcription factor bHLH95-like [Salvia miltiorrhiza]|uniref:transcription factor bHLH95-like n=1 Tax=Salvia miltiorrhiza TaxID=226208 RepID=UPI0025AB7D6E|nr:transcription factor bHLH95-like [Salvia miltiorrhiza]
MVEEAEHDSSLLWNDDQSWAFPVLPVHDNGGKLLIDGGKILLSDGAAVSEQAANDKGKKRSGCGSGESDDHDHDHELHIWTERERRKKMRNMFATLHSLIPHLHPRADKSSIVDEAVIHIKNMQQTLEDLEKQKEEKLKGGQSREAFLAEQGSTSQSQLQPNANANGFFFKTWTSPNVVMNVCGNDAHFNIVCSPIKPGLMTYVVFLMDKYNLHLVSAHVASDPTARTYMLHTRANGIPQQFPEAASFLVEETYKQTATELMLWINS